MTAAPLTERTGPLQPGDRIARKLELVRHLGVGGMGTLWVARNLATEAEVAIKVLRQGRDEDGAHAVERFRHEAKIGGMLAHRNITRVFDLLEHDDGSLVLVMELLHGQTLGDLYKSKGSLSCREAVEIIVPILGALQHAHDHGVVHRDVKPSNIFLDVDPDGHTTPKLLDFGIAKTHDASVLTRTGHALGTPSYMSPEQVRANELDGRSDLFSVGVVLYELITGANPFDASAPSAQLAQVLELEIDPDPRIEPRVWLEVQRALAKQTYERHASAVEFAAALGAAVGLPAEPQRRESPVPRSHQARVAAQAIPADERHDTIEDVDVAAVVPSGPPRALVAAAVAVVLVLVVCVFVLLRSSRTPQAVDPSQNAPSTPTAALSHTVPVVVPPPPTAATQAGPTTMPSAVEEPHIEFPVTPGTTQRRRNPPRHSPAPSATTSSVARTPGF